MLQVQCVLYVLEHSVQQRFHELSVVFGTCGHLLYGVPWMAVTSETQMRLCVLRAGDEYGVEDVIAVS